MQQKIFEDIKKNYVLTPWYIHSVSKKATVTTDASEKAVGGVPLQERQPVIYVSRKFNSAQQNYLNIELQALATVLLVTSLKQFLVQATEISL